MKIHVAKWGNSLGVRLPKSAATALGVTSGSSVEIDVHDDIVTLRRSEPSLAELLDAVTTDNLHGETDTGMPQGSEVW